MASPTRFVAITIQHQSASIGAVDADQQSVLAPLEVALSALRGWLKQNLHADDAVVLASQANIWHYHDLLAPIVASVLVAHPQLSQLLPHLYSSASPRDTIKLAQLHAAGLVPALWSPAQAARDIRALTAQRRRLIIQHAEASAALGGIVQRHRLKPPGNSRLGSDRPDWWARIALPPHDRALARDNLAALNRAANLLADLEARLVCKSAEDPWQASVDLLLQMPGMRPLEAITLLGAIGEITRFPSSNQLVGYSGLIADRPAGAQLGASEAGRQSQEGRREIRESMLEVAEKAVRSDAHWREVFEALCERAGPQRAMVAVARKLLVLLWRTLTAQANGQQPAITAKPTTRIAA